MFPPARNDRPRNIVAPVAVAKARNAPVSHAGRGGNEHEIWEMFMKYLATLAVALVLPGAALAGDPAAGEREFRKCQACHVVEDPDGNVLAGRGKTGPNLWGMLGAKAGSVEGFRYGDGLVEAGEKGLVWDAETFAAYLANPQGFLREFTGNSRARSNMAFRLPNGADDIWAYFETLMPAAEEAAEG